MSGRPQRVELAVAIGVWIIAVGVGMKLILDHQSRPGKPAMAPATMTATGRPALILIAHPRCPCTRAAVSNLERIMARAEGRLDARVLFVLPPGRDASWAHTDLWRSVSAIPHVTVAIDANGREARTFGTTTSGQVLLYDAGGRLVFAGGITPGRGHAGDNAGSDAVMSFVHHGSATSPRTPVYGCALVTQSEDGERSHASCPE